MEVEQQVSCCYLIQEAIDNGDSHTLQRILEERQGKINVNTFNTEGQTALHICCSYGNLELVKLLVKFGADIRLANRDGWSPYHIAAFSGHRDIVLYLINVYPR